jgi:hypothetical protein
MAIIATSNATTPSSSFPNLPDNGLAVTPSATDTFASPVTIFVGVGGTVVCTPAGKQADVTVTVPSGGFVPFRVGAVKTGGTATGLVAVY